MVTTRAFALVLTIAAAGGAYAALRAEPPRLTAHRPVWTEIAAAPVPVRMWMMAIAHTAIFDAVNVNATERKYSIYAVEVAAAPGASPEAAAAAAAYGILERLFPTQKAMIDAALANSLKEIADGSAVEDARVWGGIHFGSADEHATELGCQVAEFVLKTPPAAKIPLTRETGEEDASQ